MTNCSFHKYPANKKTELTALGNGRALLNAGSGRLATSPLFLPHRQFATYFASLPVNVCVEESTTGRAAQCTKEPSGPFSERSNKMARKTKNDPNQFDLFAQESGVALVHIPDQPEPDNGAMDCRKQTRIWLTKAIKQSGKSREMVADLLSGYTGVQISKDTIDMWTKDSHPSDVPGHFIPALTVILGANFLDWFAQKAGCRVAGTHELYMVQLGQMVVIRQHADQQMQRLIHDLPLMRHAGGEA